MPVISKQMAHELNIPHDSVQTILINKRFGYMQAIDWLKQHNYRHDNFRKTKNYFRFMQTFPINSARYRTYRIPNQPIDIVYQEY